MKRVKINKNLCTKKEAEAFQQGLQTAINNVGNDSASVDCPVVDLVKGKKQGEAFNFLHGYISVLFIYTPK